jgi:ubiquinone/menaquinone biosynthesis C-methylase UbiE
MRGSPADDRQDYSFDPFARHPFYYTVNQSLVHLALERLMTSRPPGDQVRVVELASGTGLVTQIIFEELARLGRQATMTCIEPSGEARALARERLHRYPVHFLEGDADQLAGMTDEVDLVFCCNAIHLIPHKPEVIAKIAGVLLPGGFFACNTAFFAGALPPGGEQYSFLLIRRAIGWLRQHHPTVRPTRRGQVASIEWLSASDYDSLLEEHGFHVTDHAFEEAVMPIEAVQDIGRYWLFIEGALPGVPIALGAAALRQAAVEAAEELNMAGVPRIWLQLVAQRRSERSPA